MDARNTGLLIVLAGLVVVVLGLLFMTGVLSWFGRLPGDIRYEGGNARVYVPITSMLLVSVALSVILYIARRLF